jgi:hypothetical protein
VLYSGAVGTGCIYNSRQPVLLCVSVEQVLRVSRVGASCGTSPGFPVLGCDLLCLNSSVDSISRRTA